jgi:predicted ABC-type ATPase
MEKTCEIFNKDGKRAIDAKSIASLTECVMDLPQTKLDHISKNGEYSESRKKLHSEIIQEFKEGVVCIDKGKPIAVLMGGSPASGKSTFLKKYRPYLLTDNLFKVDADEIRAKLPEYKGWNATQTHEETGDIVKTLISDKNIGVPCKFDFIYDGTMTSTKKYLSLVELLKEEGYDVFVVFISNIPKKVVKKRALERYQKSGRFVPMMVIDDFYENGEKTFDQVKTQVDGYIVVDGSTFDYNIMEKGGKSLPNKRLYGKLGHKLQFALGGAIGEEYNSAILTPYQNESLNKVLENPIFNNALEIETFGSGGGFVHTMVLLSNNHVVTFNHEDDNIQYSYYIYDSLEDYLSEENAATGEKGWDNEMYTPNSGMRVAEISRPTNKFFEKMKKTKSPEDWKSHGLEFIPYKDTEIMHTLDDNKYYANDAEFDTLEAAQKFYDSGEIPENIREAYRRGLFRKGGNLGKETNEMFESQIVETKHHAKELDSLVDSKTEIEPWVLAKMTRAKTDLSDLTHYLDGRKKSFENGGNIVWSDAVIGDSALVVSENKMGLIVKDYGRKFHLKFPDGKEKTYDASELHFYKLGDDEYGEGGEIKSGDVFLNTERGNLFEVKVKTDTSFDGKKEKYYVLKSIPPNPNELPQVMLVYEFERYLKYGHFKKQPQNKKMAGGGELGRIYIEFYDDYEKSAGYVIEKLIGGEIQYWNGKEWTEKFDAKTFKTKALAQKELKNAQSPEKMSGGGMVKKDRNGKDVKIGDAIHIRVLTGRYGETKDYEGIVTDFDQFGNVELDGERSVRYQADYKHNDYEHGHHVWVEKINAKNINDSLRIPKKFRPTHSSRSLINGEKVTFTGDRKEFEEFLAKKYPSSIHGEWNPLYNKGWRFINGKYISPSKEEYDSYDFYTSAESGQGYLSMLLIPLKKSKKSEKMSGGGEVDDDDDYNEIDYNNISDVQDELGRLKRWANMSGSKGADSKIEQLEARIEYLKSNKKMAGGGDIKNMDWWTMWTREGLQVELGEVFYSDSEEENEIEFRRISVKSIDEAVKVVKNFIAENDLGISEFFGGQIYKNGKPIAYVSYNLKVWEGKVGNLNSEPYQYMSGGKVHFKPSDFYKLGGSVEDMTPVEAFFSQLDYSKLPDGFANYVRDEILTDPELEAVSENDPIFIEIESKVNSLMGKMAMPVNDENSETLEAIDLLNELAVDQEGEEKRETLEAIELLKELLV